MVKGLRAGKMYNRAQAASGKLSGNIKENIEGNPQTQSEASGDQTDCLGSPADRSIEKKRKMKKGTHGKHM
ncbi:hypothetical protein GOBAR_AA06900 [Gossypium barbadense]|uniref:Uncharacterized protein n=1 Tax=Gossypium barbadense TaxID=3634 RepID=A0A2P5YDM6_GOSBA|nr:hypothetical protein GOBAR_AA06900 [Gossypium barbadense]